MKVTADELMEVLQNLPHPNEVRGPVHRVCVRDHVSVYDAPLGKVPETFEVRTLTFVKEKGFRGRVVWALEVPR